MSDLALRAMMQQLLGGVLAEEDALLLQELARRLILSGTTVAANGLVDLGTVTGDFPNLETGDIQADSANIDVLTANTAEVLTANVDALTANTAEIATGNVATLFSANANITTVRGTNIYANLVSANTVTGNNIVIPVV